VTHDEDGIGDPSISFDYNLFGAKAMSREEFASSPDKIFGGLHAVVTLPFGSYNSSQANNIGSNRYAVKITFNLSIPWNDGNTWWDNYPFVRVFGNNNQYLGNNVLGQNPMWGYQTYLSHNLSPGFYVHAGAIWSGGGVAGVNGAPAGSSLSNWQGLVGFGANLWKGGSVICTYAQTINPPANNLRSQSVFGQVPSVRFAAAICRLLLDHRWCASRPTLSAKGGADLGISLRGLRRETDRKRAATPVRLL
jgi:hypothetical protein